MPEVMPFIIIPAPWMVDANCRGMDPNIFYPEVGENADRAKAICNGTTGKVLKDGTVIATTPACPVKEQCLQYAIEHPGRGYGIWGGMSERERRNVAQYGTPTKPRKPRSDKDKKGKSRKRPTVSYAPAHGTITRYHLEISVNGTPCQKCQAAKDASDHPTPVTLRLVTSTMHGEPEN